MTSGPTREELAEMPEYVLKYMAPMQGPGAPYRDELIRRDMERRIAAAAPDKQEADVPRKTGGRS